MPSSDTHPNLFVLRGKHVVLGISGSIAAYKSLLLTRLLKEAQATVWPVLTRHARRFVTPLSLAVLAGKPVTTSLWKPGGNPAQRDPIPHISLAQRSELLIIAPASADRLAQLAAGRADDPMGAIVLSTQAPQLVAPAMEPQMWQHPATQHNVALLHKRGVIFVSPEEGFVASGGHGIGRMASPEAIMEAAKAALTPQDFAGQRVLITAGPTQEAWDPARFVSSPATGKMGYALAQAARQRGAQVHLVSGPTQVPPPLDVRLTRVQTTSQMLEACQKHVQTSTLLIMAAAPANFRPQHISTHKLKNQPPGQRLRLTLESTPDILLTLQARSPQRVVVGFAAETQELLKYGQSKLQNKDLDMVVANPIGQAGMGFGSDTNAAYLMFQDQPTRSMPLMPKEALAHHILDSVCEIRKQRAAFPLTDPFKTDAL